MYEYCQIGKQVENAYIGNHIERWINSLIDRLSG